MQCRNFNIMQWIVTDKDSISMFDGHSFPTDPFLSIIKILSAT